MTDHPNTVASVDDAIEQAAARMAKLPRWAQNRIHKLEADLADAQARLNAGPDDSDTFADPYSRFGGVAGNNAIGRPLGKGTRIRFIHPDDRDRFGSRYFIDVTFDSANRKLEVQASDAIVVAPVASNVVTITRVGRE